MDNFRQEKVNPSHRFLFALQHLTSYIAFDLVAEPEAAIPE